MSWVDKAIDQANNAIVNAPVEVKPVLEAGIKVLQDNKDAIVKTSAIGFATIVSYLALGDHVAAQEEWVSSPEASFEDLMGQLDKDSQATVEEAKTREEMWNTIEKVGLEFLAAAGKAAVPLLIAAFS